MKHSVTMKVVISLLLVIFIYSAGRMLYLLNPLNQLEFNLKLLFQIPLVGIGTAAAVLLFWVLFRPIEDSSTPAE